MTWTISNEMLFISQREALIYIVMYTDTRSIFSGGEKRLYRLVDTDEIGYEYGGFFFDVRQNRRKVSR